MINATDSQKLLQLWEQSDTHLRVVTEPGYPTAAGVTRAIAALCHEVRALTLIVKAGQK